MSKGVCEINPTPQHPHIHTYTDYISTHKGKGKGLGVGAHRELASERIGETVHGLLLANGARRSDAERHVVVAEGDGYILGHIAGMEHI